MVNEIWMKAWLKMQDTGLQDKGTNASSTARSGQVPQSIKHRSEPIEKMNDQRSDQSGNMNASQIAAYEALKKKMEG
jgi:hypothetical protein